MHKSIHIKNAIMLKMLLITTNAQKTHHIKHAIYAIIFYTQLQCDLIFDNLL